MPERNLINIWIDKTYRISRWGGNASFFAEEGPIEAQRDIREYIPELYGMEAAFEAVMSGREESIRLENIERNGFYFNLVVVSERSGLMIFVTDATEAVSDKRHLLQIQNENRLLVEQLEQLNHDLERRIEAALKRARANDYRLIEQSRSAMMGEMIANIAHQWRQPLNTLGLLHFRLKDAWRRGKLDDDFIENFYKKSETLIQGMSATIDDFRHFFKPADTRERFDVSGAVASAVSMFELMWKNSDVSILLPQRSGLYADGYRNQLMQVIVNLLANAKDAIEAKGDNERRIVLDWNLDADRVCISVEDTGGGIDADVLPKIFDPYFSTKGENGTGLGLYMSKVIIEKNFSGTFSVENTGKGAKFKMTFPVYQAE